MKSFFLFFITVVIVGVSYNVCFEKKQKEVVSEVTLDNIEALATSEKTDTGTCYLELQNGTDSKWLLFCDERTDASGIYPCPTTDSNGYYNEFAKDRCTR